MSKISKEKRKEIGALVTKDEEGSILGGFRIFKHTDKHTRGENEYLSFSNSANYLRSELMIDFQAERDRNMMIAVNEPEQFIHERTQKIRDLVEQGSTVNTYFKERITELVNMGIPPDQARAMALKSARGLLNEQVQVLELKWPGLYEKAFGAGGEANEDIYKKAGNMGISADETVAEYKLRKKGKKALASMNQ